MPSRLACRRKCSPISDDTESGAHDAIRTVLPSDVSCVPMGPGAVILTISNLGFSKILNASSPWN